MGMYRLETVVSGRGGKCSRPSAEKEAGTNCIGEMQEVIFLQESGQAMERAAQGGGESPSVEVFKKH